MFFFFICPEHLTFIEHKNMTADLKLENCFRLHCYRTRPSLYFQFTKSIYKTIRVAVPLFLPFECLKTKRSL